MQNPRLRRISALCAARPPSLVFDMSAPAALLRLELHPYPGGGKGFLTCPSIGEQFIFSDGL
ncbi:MAG: hypothetical protein Q3970_03600 [Neisseria sp.]|nr:hypothetical protein [Neisseria sp.]MDO4906861.1 hypothetical protein [Neisseria sp.]